MSIYLDNGSTTLQKPPEVAAAVAESIETCGNAGRSFYDSSIKANRVIYTTRLRMAQFFGKRKPECVALTSGFTEGLNLLAYSLLQPGDHILVSVAEHNAVLRPLRFLGCEVEVILHDDDGLPIPEAFRSALKPNTKAMFLNHASNVTGRVSNVRSFATLCREAGIPLVLDVAQSLGHIPVTSELGDIAVFTGHKGLMGPQGTGGIVAMEDVKLRRIAKTGGTNAGHDGLQEASFPGAFEAGTPNAHSFAGLVASLDFINKVGISNIHAHEIRMWRRLVEGIIDIPGIIIYALGDVNDDERMPIVSINMRDMPSGELSLALWEKYGIATRPGVHCAPKIHRHFRTHDRGMTRLSLSYFNTEEDVDAAIKALEQISTT